MSPAVATDAPVWNANASDAPATMPCAKRVLLAQAPVGYWRLDEVVGLVAKDSSGFARDGAIAGGVTLGTLGALPGDPTSAAMFFNGIDGKVTVPFNAAFSSAAVTLGAWLWFSSNPAGNAAIIANANVGLSTGVRMEITSAGKLLFLAKPSNASITTAAAMGLSAWHRVIGVYDGANLLVYIDGVLRGGPTAGAMTPNSTQEIRIGSPISTAAFWTGGLKDPFICPGGWSQARVSDDYLAGSVPMGALSVASDALV